MIRIISLLVLLTSSNWSIAQNYFSENERYYRLTNGLELLLIKDASQDEINLSYTSKTGAYTETEELNGVTKVYGELFFIKSIKNPSTVNNQEIFHQGILQSYSIGEEHLSFNLSFHDINLLDTGLEFLKKQLQDTTITQSAIDFTTNRLSRNYITDKAEKLLWGDYHHRINLQIHPDSINERLKGKLKTVQELNFCPQNSLVIITGNLDYKTVLEQVQKSLGKIEKCNFSYFNQYPIPNTEPLHFNQQILSYEQTNFRAEYYFQGPTLRDDLKSILAGSILTQLLKDYYGREGITFIHSSNYYANTMKLEAKANSKEKFMELHNTIKQDFLGDGKLSFITDDKIDIAKNAISQQLDIILNTPKIKFSLMQMMWASKDINLLSELNDEVNKITLSDIETLIDKYMKQNHYILNLVVPSVGALSDSLEVETANNLNQYELLFKRNSADFVDASQDSILNNLLFFLKINPDTKVKIVGIASKSELTEVKDKETYKFIKDEFEGFNIFPPSLRPSSSKIRLDIYRSVKIAEKIYNAGSDISKLFGSGRLESEDKEEYYKVYFREME